MGKHAFDKIAAGLEEVLEITKGNANPARVHVPFAIDVQPLRRRLGLSQADFAARFGFTINQIRDWEQGRSRPLGGVRAYLMLIERSPEVVRDLLRAATRERTA